jgi:hypothetical protein
VSVEYIISIRGRPIGTTELDFIRIDGLNRSGWFHPNSFGEGLMPTVALALPAMRAYLCRNQRGDDGQPLVQESFRRSSLFADLAEALKRVEEMELTLHHPDGTLIATSTIGLQDTDQLRALAEWKDCYPVGEIPDGTEEWVQELEREFEDSESDSPESDEELFDIAIGGEWAPDEERIDFPRYQVHLLLSKEDAIP